MLGDIQNTPTHLHTHLLTTLTTDIGILLIHNVYWAPSRPVKDAREVAVEAVTSSGRGDPSRCGCRQLWFGHCPTLTLDGPCGLAMTKCYPWLSNEIQLYCQAPQWNILVWGIFTESICPLSEGFIRMFLIASTTLPPPWMIHTTMSKWRQPCVAPMQFHETLLWQ